MNIERETAKLNSQGEFSKFQTVHLFRQLHRGDVLRIDLEKTHDRHQDQVDADPALVKLDIYSGLQDSIDRMHKLQQENQVTWDTEGRRVLVVPRRSFAQ